MASHIAQTYSIDYSQNHSPEEEWKITFLHPELQQHSGWCVTLISHDVSRLSSTLNFSIPTRWASGTDVGRHRRGRRCEKRSAPANLCGCGFTPTPVWTAIAKKKKKKKKKEKKKEKKTKDWSKRWNLNILISPAWMPYPRCVVMFLRKPSLAFQLQ